MMWWTDLGAGRVSWVWWFLSRLSVVSGGEPFAFHATTYPSKICWLPSWGTRRCLHCLHCLHSNTHTN